jgi:small subunit ribosomal protein S9
MATPPPVATRSQDPEGVCKKGTYATGKRKTAIARVWIAPGAGVMTVNQQPADEYFERMTSRMIARQSLELIEAIDQYDVWATVCGGGKSAQAEAIRHGVSRALCVVDAEKRTALKRAGFLTRDARKKERKKYGQPGARKRFQYSKR